MTIILVQNVSQNNTMNEGAKAFYDEEKKHFRLFEKTERPLLMNRIICIQTEQNIKL